MGQLWANHGPKTEITYPLRLGPTPAEARAGGDDDGRIQADASHAVITFTLPHILGVPHAKGWWTSLQLFQKRESGSCVLR